MNNQLTTIRQSISWLMPHTMPRSDERWLYVLMLLVPESIYGWLLYSTPPLQSAPGFFIITMLFVLHGALYLLAHRLPRHMGWIFAYALLQATLIFAIVVVTRDTTQPITLFLYASLAAQLVGLFDGQLKPAIAVAAIVLGIIVVDHLFFWGWTALVGFLLVTLPMTAFLMALVYLYLRQTHARQEAQGLLAALEDANQQLAAYAAHVEDLTLAAERQRMARELHDTLAQGLAGLLLQLEAVESHLERGNTARAQTIIGQAMPRARRTLADARRAIDDLREGNFLSDLHDSLCAEIARFSETTGLPCSTALHAPDNLPPALQETILRIASEGLANIARHAQARHAWLTLCQEQQALTLTVRDDGNGFDPATATGGNGHYGLIGLRERAQLAGGTLGIVSTPGVGTTLTLRLPLSVAEVAGRWANG